MVFGTTQRKCRLKEISALVTKRDFVRRDNTDRIQGQVT